MANKNDKKKKHKLAKKFVWWMITGAVVLIVAGVWVVVGHRSGMKNMAQAGSVSDTSAPTPEEQATGNEQKQRDVDRENTDNTPTPPPTGGNSSKKTVTPIITFADVSAGNLEVGAFLSDVYEDGGTCTLTGTNGGQTVTATAKAIKSATTTNCQSLTIPVSSFPVKGSWSFTVSYSSTTAAGTSAARSVDIQ